MKNKILLLFCLLCNCCIQSSLAQSTERIKLNWSLRGTMYKDCSGMKALCFRYIYDPNRIATKDDDIIELSIMNGRLYLDIIQDSSPAEEDENIFYVFQPIEIPAEIAKELGYEKIVIRPGEYPLNKSRNPLGTVHLQSEFD